MNKEQLMLTLGIDSATEITLLSRSEAMQSTFAGLKQIASNNDPSKQKDLMYVTFVLCHEGANGNGDYFFKEELENAYLSPIHKVYDWEHGNVVVGTITDSVLVKPESDASDTRWRIECAGVIWKWVFPKYAQLVEDDALTGRRRNSMECYFTDYVYIIGDESNMFSRNERPELEDCIGGTYEGRPVYRGLKGVFFGGAGIVENPADKDAVFKSVASRISTQSEKSPFDVEASLDEVIQASAVSEEVASVADEVKSEDTQVEEVVETAVAEEEAAVEEIEEAVAEEEAVEEEVETEVVQEEETAVAEEAPVEEALEEATEEATEETAASEEEEIVEQAEAGKFNDILERWTQESQFYSSFDALYSAIDSVMWGGTEDKPAAVMAEINSFAQKIFSLLPNLLEMYGLASVEASVAASKADMQQELEALQKELNRVSQEYDDFKAQIEAEKKEAELDALADMRVSDLIGAGLRYSNERIATIKSKVRAMSEEEYLDFKNLLVETRYSGVASAEAKADEDDSPADKNTSEAQEKTPEEGTPNPAILAALNIESVETATLEDEYRELVSELKISKPTRKKLHRKL